MDDLLERYRHGQLSRAELEEGLKMQWDNLNPDADEVKALHRPEMLTSILKKDEHSRGVVRVHWWKFAAVAASVVVVVFTVALWWKNESKEPVSVKNDVQAPVNNRAMIVLGDGKTTIYLDSAARGELASVNGVEMVKMADGSIAYKGSASEIQYHTFINPPNSKTGDITLADGTHIWLNSGSSITYPTAFAGGKRVVTLKGEGYFEVAHDAKKPFIVQAKGTEVQVYGTEFNLKAYDDESELRATLLKGSVGITHNGQQKMIVPGEQAIVNDAIRVKKDVDMDEVTAWKSGYFSFNNQSVGDIMKQLARWYDIDVVMETDNKQTFTIINSGKDLPISNLLHGLETSGGVHFEIRGKKVIVKP